MCLLTNRKLTARLRRQLKKSEKIVTWKLLRIVRPGDDCNSKPSAVTLRSVSMCFDWKPGWNVSDRTLQHKRLERGNTYLDKRLVSHGIHVFLDRTDPITDVDAWQVKAVPVTCYIRDFVAANEEQAVFRKVYLRKADYEAAIAED